MSPRVERFPRALLGLALVTAVAAVAACSSSPQDGSDGGPDASTDAPLGDTAPAGDADAGGCAPEYADGYYPAPVNTFTIPASAISSAQEIWIPDVQAKFPQVDWTTLDRLYIPAGHYALLKLGNLPQRDASRPLVITNLGGQVIIGGLGANYLVALEGGSNWSFTGRYDATAKTGDAAFPGHRCGDYAGSRGHYGILVDDGWPEFPDQTKIGVAIGGSAHDFQVEFVEITNVGFCGVMAKNHDATIPIMHHMRFHDLYIHDVGSEGFYVGDTDIMNPVPYDHVSIYNNRVLRTGSEVVQTGQLGDGSEIYNNVFALGGRMWRDAFECTVQDGNAQYGQRNGVATVHDNVFLGATQELMQTFRQIVPGDPHAPTDSMTIEHNYFAATGWLGVYLHVASTPVGFTTIFRNNFFRDMGFTYGELYPNLTERTFIFGGSGAPNEPVLLENNVLDTTWSLTGWGGTPQNPDGTFGQVVASGTVKKTLPPIQFVDFGLPADTDYRHVEFWVPKNGCYNQWSSGQADPNAPAPVYQQGTIVMYRDVLYRLDATSSQGEEPDEALRKSTSLGVPKDDVRLVSPGDYAGIGLAY